MLNVNSVLRTVRVAVPYKENATKDGNKFASMYFSCASARGVKKEEGKIDTDFLLVKFTGKLADVMRDYASATNEEGKLASRHIYVSGHLETYQAERPVEFDTVIDGEEYTVKSTVKETRFVLVAEHVEFLDSSKKAEGKTAPTVTVTAKKPAEKPAEASSTTTEEEVPQVEMDAIPEAFE